MDAEGRRSIMKLARLEAARLGHGFIATEHVLIALAEPPGIAARVLAEQGLDRERLRDESARRVTRSPTTITRPQLPFTPSAKRVLERSVEEARALGQEIGPEHLLLALLGEPDGVASQVLADLGLELGAVRERIAELART